MQIINALHQIDVRLFSWLFGSGKRYVLIAPARAISRSGDWYIHALLPFLLLGMGLPGADTVVFFQYGAAASVMLVWASLVALSRVILGGHFPGDILAGATLVYLVTHNVTL